MRMQEELPPPSFDELRNEHGYRSVIHTRFDFFDELQERDIDAAIVGWEKTESRRLAACRTRRLLDIDVPGFAQTTFVLVCGSFGSGEVQPDDIRRKAQGE